MHDVKYGHFCSYRCKGLYMRDAGAIHVAERHTVKCAFPECNNLIVYKDAQVRKYCSSACYNKHKMAKSSRASFTCSYCGATFERLVSQVHTKTPYCSLSCRSHDKERREAAVVHLRKRVMVKCSSPGCTEMFEAKEHRVKKSKRLYCKKHSYTGHVIEDETREKIRQANIARDAVAPLKKKWADPEFRKAFGESRRGPNSPVWKGGSSLKGYPEDFMLRIRHEIKFRDDHTCGLCHAKKRHCDLHVHHIDQNKDNSDTKNLITLCRNCHGKVHTKRMGQVWRRVLRDLVAIA